MRLLRLAVFFDIPISAGGGYQQSLNAALKVKELANNKVEYLFFTTIPENIEVLSQYGFQVELIKQSLIEKLILNVRRNFRNAKLIKLIKFFFKYNSFERRFLINSIDLVYFLSPTGPACDLEEINYIFTIWDLAHLDEPEFPEVRWNREFERRENHYQEVLPRATAIIVDSEVGKENLINHYRIQANRVYVAPFQAAVTTREKNISPKKNDNILKKYSLNVPYIYYPAQFWAHKNHIYLLRGIRALEDEYGISIGAIFSGGDKGNLTYIKECTKKLGLTDRIRFVGFVSNEEIPTLYEQSIALVMPTYFGPTNLPPLEAFELNVPVLYSNKIGLRDQGEDAVLLIDLDNPSSMALKLAELIRSPNLREKLIENGKKLVAKNLEVKNPLEEITEKFICKRICWE